jgi:hypothetical protein
MSQESAEVVRQAYKAYNAGGLAAFGALEFTRIFTVRKGLITCIEIFRDHAEALAAVGLSE